MNEEYLQLIWDRARLPMPQLKLRDGKELIVKKTGDHNLQFSGPDFYNACIQYDDLEFHGAVEIHVNGSDWYKHKHHLDAAYNNVVLHVVYNDDVPVTQNGLILPTLELKSYLDQDHFIKMSREQIQQKEFPCEHMATQIDSIYWSSMKTKALIEKLAEKVKPHQEDTDEQSLYSLIAASFGMGINKKAFEELARRITWQELKLLSRDQRHQLILARSGWMQSDFTHGHGADYRWHFKGTRPSNFPSKRLPQFAGLMAELEMTDLINIIRLPKAYLNFQLLCTELKMEDGRALLTNTIIESLAINAIVPFLWRMGEQVQRDYYHSLALDVLQDIPAERNSIISKWNKLGIPVKNALDSQGLLALHRYYCCAKKCLSCEVGLKALDRIK
jgi:hypothetical protein